ncbi:ATP-binding protein [Reichenbachiella sp.]|uniref:ATP-binding protein n=1 Tax=Reichenbachiella sp. TaxID=2184521 RepID=UPI003BB1EFAC
MSKNAFFKVDTKLAKLLGETYRSTEEAVKELIDNAYDADSENVTITLPTELEASPVISITDDGTGMKENELRSEYLNVANSRRSRKGDRTQGKNRKVKGRKGIGKFSGLMVAETMKVETSANGITTILTINRNELAKGDYDLEKVPLPIETRESNPNEHGTTITLEGLNDNYHYPNPTRLKQLLIIDYGREKDFTIKINDEVVGVLDVQGQSYNEEIEIDGVKALLKYTVADKPIKQAGISIRVNNKIIGKPKNYLSEDELIPKKLQNRIYGEIICDELENDITADFGAVIENSKLNKVLTEKTVSHVKKSVDAVFATDMKMARARYQRKINKELEKLEEFKQPFARKALYKTLEKFYGESEERINTVISVMVSAMEKDHYWGIIQSIEDTPNHDVEKLADALGQFGLIEMSIISSQALNRLRYLDELSIIIDNPKTKEGTIHKALENNTWVLGEDYSVLISDQNLKAAVSKIHNKKYKGDKAKNRPDLLRGENQLTSLS